MAKKCLCRHADGEEKPTKRSKKESTQGAVAILKHGKVQGCISQNSQPKKSILRKAEQVRGTRFGGRTVKFSGRTWYEIRIRETKGPSLGIIQKGDTHERNPCAPKFEERTPEETSRQEDCARNAAWDLAKILSAQSRWWSYVSFSCENKGTGASLQKHSRAYVCGWFGSFNAQAEQEGLKLRWTGYFEKIQKPHNGGDLEWGSANKRGSTSVCSSNGSVRHSANTRSNVSSSIAWQALLRTQIFIWVEKTV